LEKNIITLSLDKGAINVNIPKDLLDNYVGIFMSSEEIEKIHSWVWNLFTLKRK
jgi:hypothetical protein